MASSSAMTTRVVTRVPLSLGPGLGHQPVEQLVLGLLQPVDLVEDLGAVTMHRIGMALGVVVLPVGEGRLRDERPEPRVVGRLGQVAELLVGHGQLVAQLLEARADVGQAAFDEGPGHPRQRTPAGGSARICDDAAMVRRTPRRRSASAALCSLLLAGGCGGEDAGDGGCGPITREGLDPAYLVHVLGTDDEVAYTSDPPTSGPHQPAPAVEGVSDEPIPRPVQVGILERGDVLLQHDPDLAAVDTAALEELAGDGVVVAPNADLPSQVVATAWLFKRTCDEVDVAALEEFADERRGKGPDG